MEAWRPIFRSIGSLLAIAALAAACEPVASGVAPRQKKTLSRSGDQPPVPPQPIDEQPTPEPGPAGTPAPTPEPVVPPVTATPTPAPSATPTPQPAAPALLGLITAPAPLIANNGAGLISDRGGSLISDRGGSLISNNGAGLLS
ncbi:MAG: hypothetical protein ACLGIN_00090, partial [Candidatus Sericytochromatia bacterium]